jgi:hypothetical protein
MGTGRVTGRTVSRYQMTGRVSVAGPFTQMNTGSARPAIVRSLGAPGSGE